MTNYCFMQSSFLVLVFILTAKCCVMKHPVPVCVIGLPNCERPKPNINPPWVHVPPNTGHYPQGDQGGSSNQGGSNNQQGSTTAATTTTTTTGKPKEARPLYKEDPAYFNETCVCGQEQIFGGKHWNVYIQINSSKLSAKPPPCLGTVIAHNLVVTSHKCLVPEGKKLAPYDLWMPPPSLRVSDAASPEDLTIVTWRDSSFKVKKIVYHSGYSPYAGVDAASANDIAILVIDDDLFKVVEFEHESYDHFRLPVCIPKSSEVDNTLDNLVFRLGYYYGIEREIIDDDFPTFEMRVANNLVIFEGEECDNEINEGEFSTDVVLCTRTWSSLPTIPGGPLLTTNLSGYFVEPFDEKDEYNPPPPQTSFLVGINTVTKRYAKGRRIGYSYFANVLANIEFIEQVSMMYGSLWCQSPDYAETKKATEQSDLELKIWGWESEPNQTRDESLECACGLKNSDKKVIGKILGGEDAIPREFGWMVKFVASWIPDEYDLQKFGTNLCGASIINDRVLLTAAHCIVEHADDGNENGVPYELITGHKLYIRSHRVDTDEKAAIMVKAKEFIIHPGFLPNLKNRLANFDIALIILESPITFSRATTRFQTRPRDIRPICLSRIKTKIPLEPGTELTAIGWGEDDTPINDGEYTKKLQKIQLLVRPYNYCFKKYYGIVPDTTMCASGTENSTGLTQGDDGGPAALRLADNYFQVGISSYAKVTDIPREEGDILEWNSYLVDLQQFIPFVEYYSNKEGAKWCKY